MGASEGLSNTEIARRERVSLPTVGKWRSRYAREKIEALADQPRSGAPRSIGDKKVEEVLTKTLETDSAGSHALEQPPHGQGSRHFRAFGLANRRAFGLSRTGWTPSR